MSRRSSWKTTTTNCAVVSPCQRTRHLISIGKTQHWLLTQKGKLHSSSCSFPCTDITISYKNRLIHTYSYIINTSLLALCHSDMFRPSKGHLQGARLIHCCENVSVVLPEDGASMAEIYRKDTILLKWC